MRSYIFLLLMWPLASMAQLHWINVDSLYQPLPKQVHVYFSNDSIEGKPNRSFYVEAALKNRSLHFLSDTTHQRRLTPEKFYEKNDHPLLVVNCTFFEFVHNSNLNLVVNKGKILSNNSSIAGRGKDTFTYQHPFMSAIGISKNRHADVAWTFTHASQKSPYAMQEVLTPLKDAHAFLALDTALYYTGQANEPGKDTRLKKWKVQTAVGGGPVLLQNGKIAITNNEELKFSGKAISDKHPRTGMGYTGDGRLIVLVVQGRFAGIAEGVTLTQEAEIFKQLNCVEALNLDGGGSSCMLVNGKQTIQPSDKEGQRPVPAVFMIK